MLLSLPLMLAASSVPAAQASRTDPHDRASSSQSQLPAVTVHGMPAGWRAKLEYILPEVQGTKITVTTKATVTHMDQIPTVAQDNLDELFARSPGLVVAQQQDPTQVNLSYRGLGNPQESEYVLVMQDGIPMEADWIGFPVLYYLPPLQEVANLEVIRGGNSLLYGPEPAPAINFVSRSAQAGQPSRFSTEQIGGSHGLWQSDNVAQGSAGDFAWRVDGWVNRSRGERRNADYRVKGGDLSLLWTPSAQSSWRLDGHLYRASAGDAGRLDYATWKTAPHTSNTPTDRTWSDRSTLVLTHTRHFGEHWLFVGKLWSGEQHLDTRSADAYLPPQSPPASTSLEHMRFRYAGTDLRLRHRWGHGSAFTVGTTLYHDDAPLHEWSVPGTVVSRGDTAAGSTVLAQARRSDYAAVFASNLFRFGRFHIVPSVRIDHEKVTVDERVRPPYLTRPLIDTRVSRTEPLFGLGLGNDFGHLNETYFNVSEGWRPVRFYDIGSPFANIAADTRPAVQKALSWEAGVHGTPVTGLFYDASVFWIHFRNRIETINLTPIVAVERNSGDSRHRGFEGELAYDFLAAAHDGRHLQVFANLQWLNARFVASDIAGQVGKVPAFAPRYLIKTGITWRREHGLRVSLTGVSSDSQYWQDSDEGATGVPARIPAYTVWNLAANVPVTAHVQLLGGVSNLGDRHYYARVWRSGIEPALGRSWYAGVKLVL